jgi:hypothetical protein
MASLINLEAFSLACQIINNIGTGGPPATDTKLELETAVLRLQGLQLERNSVSKPRPPSLPILYIIYIKYIERGVLEALQGGRTRRIISGISGHSIFGSVWHSACCLSRYS